jgi:ABC-type transport system involved in cytochrome bd biosynthesis fused ATPase/permease subunit
MQIKINIVGDKESGKSTIAKIIADALCAACISCEVNDTEPESYGKHQADRLAMLCRKNDLLVKIQTYEKINLYNW